MTAKQAIVGGAAAILLAAGIATYVIRNRGELATEGATPATILEEESASTRAGEEGALGADEEPFPETSHEIMSALQYRPESLPGGFKLLDTHGTSPNPGFISQEELERFPAAIGVDAEVKRSYYCLLSRDGNNERCLSYHVVETADHGQTIAVEQAWEFNASIGFSDGFVMRNALVKVVGFPGTEVAAKELMNNLKNAVGYVD